MLTELKVTKLHCTVRVQKRKGSLHVILASSLILQVRKLGPRDVLTIT